MTHLSIIPKYYTGLLDNWPARAKWNLDYLSQFSGPVSIDITPDGHGDCVVQDKYFVQPQQVQMPFGVDPSFLIM